LAKILDASQPDAVPLAAETIRQGGLVAFPTETVYGLGADARNPIAVARVFEAKQRPAIDPLIVHVASPEEAGKYGHIADKHSRVLMEQFWPGPLTLVVPKTELVPDIVTAGLETVALRMPAHETALALIRASRTAIAAPSANPFGYVSPTEAQHVAQHLSESVDLILNGGRCPLGIESTIISLTGSSPCLLRAGGTPIEDIERAIGKIERAAFSPDRPRAPGQLARHYATRTPLVILPGDPDASILWPGEKVGLLTLRPVEHPERYAAIEILSPKGDLREAAANLFAALRRLDSRGLDRLAAVPVPEEGLGLAIMDRLRRCAAFPS